MTPFEMLAWGDCTCSEYQHPHDREWTDCGGCPYTGADHEWTIKHAIPDGHWRVCECGVREEIDADP